MGGGGQTGRKLRTMVLEEWVPKKVAGSVRKLAGAGNLSDSSLGLGRVSHLCSELGREVPFRLETAAEWEFPERAGALTQANGSGHWGKQKETQLLLKREIGRSEKFILRRGHR